MLGLSVASLLAAGGVGRLVLLDPVADRRTRAVATVPGLVAAPPPPQIDQAWVNAVLAVPGSEGTADREGGRFEADGFDVVVEASGAADSVAAVDEASAVTAAVAAAAAGASTATARMPET